MTKLPPTHAPQSHTSPNPPPPPKGSLRRSRFLGPFTPRTVAAPLAAFTMAILLYTYSVTAIGAAKRNAALHREADGGQLDMRRESLRRHGVLDKVEGTKGLELFRDARSKVEAEVLENGNVQNESQLAIGDREAADAAPRKALEKEEEGRARTDVESELQGWKGREGQERRRNTPLMKKE